MTEAKEYKKPLPHPTSLTEPFWQACKRHELTVQRCRSCGHRIFIPQPACTACFSSDLEWIIVSGKGTVYSYSVVYRPQTPAFESPYVVAVVKLEEGPYMLSNLEGCTPKDVHIDMPVEVFFDDVTPEFSLYKFKPRVS